MDDVDFRGVTSAIGRGAQSFLRSLRFGASAWTTFTFISQLLMTACWIVALPVELMLNRRMGRRYNGVLPLILSFVAWLIILSIGVTTNIRSAGSREEYIARASVEMIINLVIVALLLFGFVRHRFSAWLRFGGPDEVHSFSNGVPFWLYPPRLFVSAVNSSLPAVAIVPPVDWRAEFQSARQSSFASLTLARRAAAQLRHHLSVFWVEWRSGQVPTGPIMWIAATVVHPILLAVAAIALRRENGPFGLAITVAAIAIFLKARIHKAMIVESIYDLSDSRLEQEFTQALADPNRTRYVERSGLVMPGIARTVVDVPAQVEPKSAVSPELAHLLSDVEGGGGAASTAPDSQRPA